jgi:hypothetical protein
METITIIVMRSKSAERRDTVTFLFCDDLAELRCGTMYLSVPVVDDVIQVGIGGDFATTILRVSIDPMAVTVWRLDGHAMQVHILRDGQESTDVFCEPVRRLRMERTSISDGRQLWEASSTAYVDRQQDLRQFVYTIARFGLAKQRRMATHLVSP